MLAAWMSWGAEALARREYDGDQGRIVYATRARERVGRREDRRIERACVPWKGVCVPARCRLSVGRREDRV